MTILASTQGITEDQRRGFVAASMAYTTWGFSVIFYKWLNHVPPDEVIAHRVVWTVILVGIYLVARGRGGEIAAALRNWSVLSRLLICSLLISCNWFVFVWAISQAKVLEISFGYFINPIVVVVLGLVLLGERLSRAQTLAVVLAVVAVAVQAVQLGGLPWVSLFLAATFAAYGYIRKLTPVRASPGLLIETALVLPLGVFYIWYLEGQGNGHFTLDALTAVLLILSGVVTSLPLILFSYGARRLKLITIGLLQYIAPSLHFIIAVFLFSEPLAPARLVSFIMIWIALTIFTVASWRQNRAGPPV